MCWRLISEDCKHALNFPLSESARLAVDFVLETCVAARGVTAGAARRACDCAVNDQKTRLQERRLLAASARH